MQRELERQPFIPPTLPMDQCQTRHLSDVGLACQANVVLSSVAELDFYPWGSKGVAKCISGGQWFIDITSAAQSTCLCCVYYFFFKFLHGLMDVGLVLC